MTPHAHVSQVLSRRVCDRERRMVRVRPGNPFHRATLGLTALVRSVSGPCELHCLTISGVRL